MSRVSGNSQFLTQPLKRQLKSPQQPQRVGVRSGQSVQFGSGAKPTSSNKANLSQRITGFFRRHFGTPSQNFGWALGWGFMGLVIGITVPPVGIGFLVVAGGHLLLSVGQLYNERKKNAGRNFLARPSRSSGSRDTGYIGDSGIYAGSSAHHHKHPEQSQQDGASHDHTPGSEGWFGGGDSSGAGGDCGGGDCGGGGH